MSGYTTQRKPCVLHFRSILTDKHRDALDEEQQKANLLAQAVDSIARILTETDGAIQINATYNPERQCTEIDHTVMVLLKEDQPDGAD